MNISEMTEQDLSALEAFKEHIWPPADHEHYGDQQPDFYKKEFTLITKDNEEIIGYITVLIDSGVAQIEPLMVKTELKGQGIGTKLIRAAEDKAKELGAHKVWLETGVDWKSKAFYEKNGYRIRTVMPNHTGGRDFVLLDKML
jgi:predicted N-acetyltransferase YhbS